MYVKHKIKQVPRTRLFVFPKFEKTNSFLGLLSISNVHPWFHKSFFFPREHRLIQWKSWKQEWQKYIQTQKFEVTSENEKESNKINLFAALLLSLSSSVAISKTRKEEALGTRLQQNYCYKTSKQVIQRMIHNRRNQFQYQCCNNIHQHNQFN